MKIKMKPHIICGYIATVLFCLMLLPQLYKSITIQINSTIGRSICKIFGDESKYMVENQYRLNRDISGWLIIPNNETTNMTLLNAESINEQCTLRNGDVISIGNIKKGINKLPLVVCLNDI